MKISGVKRTFFAVTLCILAIVASLFALVRALNSQMPQNIRPEVRIEIDVGWEFVVSSEDEVSLFEGDELVGVLSPGVWKVRSNVNIEAGRPAEQPTPSTIESTSELEHEDIVFKDVGFIFRNRGVASDVNVKVAVVAPFRLKLKPPSSPIVGLFRKGRLRRKFRSLGTIEVYTSDDKLILSTDKPVRFKPTRGGFLGLSNKQLSPTNLYFGILEFRLTPIGRVRCINEIDIEEYLKGVLAAEMSPSFPLEALKAQAVVARSFTLANWYRKIRSGRISPYDFSDEAVFQMYRGAKRVSERVEIAVDATRGEVLTWNGTIAETRYHSSCGGHTENAFDLWGILPYLQGVSDLRYASTTPDLRTESGVRAWLNASPNAFCKIPPDAPKTLQYARANYRWSVTYTRQELERIIREKTGFDPGTLLEIVPISRGVSGRVLKMMIRGTKGVYTVEGELNIRKALAPDMLKSSLFIIDVERGSDGLPELFIIKGGGFGHGVGMCQVGAAMMAYDGYDYRAILEHYFPKLELKKVY